MADSSHFFTIINTEVFECCYFDSFFYFIFFGTANNKNLRQKKSQNSTTQEKIVKMRCDLYTIFNFL